MSNFMNSFGDVTSVAAVVPVAGVAMVGVKG
jgi:hypothetical protein